MAMIIRLEGELAERLTHRARDAGMSPQEFAVAVLRKALDPDREDIEIASRETLDENQELYRRLAKGSD